MIFTEKFDPAHSIQSEEKDYEKIYTRFKGLIELSAFSLTGLKTGTDDIAQEVLLKVWVNWSRLKKLDEKELERYIRVMVRNLIFTLHRRRCRLYRQQKEFAKTWNHEYLHDEMIVKEGLRIYRKAVELLPRGQRQICQFREEEFTGREIAEVMNISTHTVKNQLRLAFKTLRRHLGKELDMKIEEDGRKKLTKMVA